jgi:hypothetical protein
MDVTLPGTKGILVQGEVFAEGVRHMVHASKIPAEIRANPSWYADVLRADDWIHSMLGKFAESKTWAWAVTVSPSGQPDFDVRLQHEDASVSERFNSFEISNEELLTKRMIRAWGRLLDEMQSSYRRDFSEMLKSWKDEPAIAN